MPNEVAVLDDPLSGALGEIEKLRSLTEVYKLERADKFAGVQAQILAVADSLLRSISKSEIKDMETKDKLNGIKNLVSAAAALFEKERLERDLSTENVSVLVMAIKEMKKRELVVNGGNGKVH